MNRQHISDEDLERYYVGKVTDESELAPLESICWLARHASNALKRHRIAGASRAAIIEGGFDLE